MPNYVKNVIECNDVDKIKEVLFTDKHVDFNNLVKRPECLDDFQPNCSVVGRAKLAMGIVDSKDDLQLELRLAIRDGYEHINIDDIYRCMKNIEETGYAYWYDWSLDNWYTKWNAGETKVEDSKIFFTTAWTGVPELMRVLYDKSGVDFTYKYADEDTGFNVGVYFFKDGEMVSDVYNGGSNDAYEISFELWPDSKDNYRFEDGKWLYFEEDEDE